MNKTSVFSQINKNQFLPTNHPLTRRTISSVDILLCRLYRCHINEKAKRSLMNIIHNVMLTWNAGIRCKNEIFFRFFNVAISGQAADYNKKRKTPKIIVFRNRALPFTTLSQVHVSWILIMKLSYSTTNSSCFC